MYLLLACLYVDLYSSLTRSLTRLLMNCIEDTIITWNDSHAKTDVALSFQEQTGCSEVWNQIQMVVAEKHVTGHPLYILDNGNQHGHFGKNLVVNGVLDEGHPFYEDVYDVGHAGVKGAVAELPEPRLDTLESITSIISECTIFQRESLSQQLLKPGYLHVLLQCFQTAEDLEDHQSILAAHALVKGIILLNDTNILEILFSDENIVTVVGALEYDPGLPEPCLGRYRKHVEGNMSLKEVVPITDAACRSKIIQAFRICYIRDTILPKVLDDATYSTLTSMYLFNIVEVLVALNNDDAFFKRLFQKISQAEKGSETWRDLISFLQELIALTRHIQVVQRQDILRHLCNLGLFQVMSDALQCTDATAKLRATESILSTAVHDPVLLRSYIQNNDGGTILFDQMVSILLHKHRSGLQEQALDIIKILLDPDTMENNEIKEKFIALFYDDHISHLMEAISSGSPDYKGDDRPTVSSLLLIIELLSYCISQHSYRIKYFILRNNVVDKILKLLERPEKSLACAALRFLKTCILMKDEFYNRYLVKNNLLRPVLVAYLRNHHRENLLHSALLDFLDLLRRENLKSLLSIVVTSDMWSDVERVGVDRAILEPIRAKHEANTCESPLHKNEVDVDATHGEAQQRHAAAVTAMRAKGEIQEDEDEDNYFREDDEDDDDDQKDQQRPAQVVLETSPPLVPGLPRLVDYDDDDDDEEDTIPLKVVSIKRKSPQRIEIHPEKKTKKDTM